MHTGFWRVNLKEKGKRGDVDVEVRGRTIHIETGSKEILSDGVDCIYLAQYMDSWRAVVNAVTNL